MKSPPVAVKTVMQAVCILKVRVGMHACVWEWPQVAPAGPNVRTAL